MGQENFKLFQGQPAVGLTTSDGSPEPEAEALWRFARKVWGLSVCYTQGQQGEMSLQTPPEHRESAGKIAAIGCGSRAHSSLVLDSRVTQAGSLGPPGQAAHVLLVGAEREYFNFASGLE